MGSEEPLQDLNLNLTPPLPPSSSSAAASSSTSAGAFTYGGITTFLKTPKLEPKTEPFDEPFVRNNQVQLQQPRENHLFSNYAPEVLHNSNFNPPSQPPTVNNGAGDSSIYSDYNRVSELFRTAFADQFESGDVSGLTPESGAIVPFASESSGDGLASPSGEASLVVSRTRYKYPPRSNELVRVSEIGDGDRRYFRDVVRKTRMLYDALRISSVAAEEKRWLSEGRVSGGPDEIVSPRHRKPRGDVLAATAMRDAGLWLNRDKRIVGSIPGIEVGDMFFYRLEMQVLGLHGQPQAGIDYLAASHSSNGEPIATSVISSGGYEDDEDAGDVIIYTGHGGQAGHTRQCMPQKLEGGNLALERSMHYGIELRVIRGIKHENVSTKIYVYDGLYKIDSCWFDVGKSGYGVYKYKLVRIEGQPEMGITKWKFAESLRTRPLSVRPKGYLSFDISNQKESLPVFLFNDLDSDHDPLYFEYLARPVFPPFLVSTEGMTGCDCVTSCIDGCPCAKKNGGEFAYDQYGFLLRGKPVLFECGPRCKCSSSCRNRVSQTGLRYRLEVFRSRVTGWGVRTLELIPAGSFICEYTGVFLTREQAQIFAMNGDTLVYPNRFAKRWMEWGDLSQIDPEYVHPSYPSIPPLDFAMDVSRMRNVACYLSHSSLPNVMVQCVMFDHNNMMFPHLMLFAMETIPPLRELSLDYGIDDQCTERLAICN